MGVDETEKYRHRSAHELELNRATAELERASLQIAFLANGGAIVAVLTLLGAVAGKEKAEKSAIIVVNLHLTQSALGVWVLGFFLAGLATVFAYVSSASSRGGPEDNEKVLRTKVPIQRAPVSKQHRNGKNGFGS
jgi:hypothetical protein